MAQEKLKTLLEKKDELLEKLRELSCEADYDADAEMKYEETESELEEISEEIEYLRYAIS